MRWPMALVRAGPAYTMSEGAGLMLALGFSVPLERAGKDVGVCEADAMLTMARAHLLAMTRMAEGEARSQHRLLLAQLGRVRGLKDEVLPRARQPLELSLSPYSAGTTPITSVVDATSLLSSVEAERVAADVELGLAALRLERPRGPSLRPSLPSVVQP